METSLPFECPRDHIVRISFAFTQTLEATTAPAAAAAAVVYSPCLACMRRISLCSGFPTFQQMVAGCRPILCIISHSQPLSRFGDA